MTFKSLFSRIGDAVHWRRCEIHEFDQRFQQYVKEITSEDGKEQLTTEFQSAIAHLKRANLKFIKAIIFTIIVGLYLLLSNATYSLAFLFYFALVPSMISSGVVGDCNRRKRCFSILEDRQRDVAMLIDIVSSEIAKKAMERRVYTLAVWSMAIGLIPVGLFFAASLES